MIVGTAGHVDHGKTALVRALTGTDTDRLPQEKARGISIDLGFAYLPLESGEVLGFVDVPGHERFMKAMLAGAGGIDFALLCVAADDGVMPQTREHLAVLDLLGATRGAVALTKCDTADAARLAEVEGEVRRLLADGPLEGAPVLPTSARSGDGIAELRTLLAGLETAPPNRDKPLRFAVDRAFSLPGAGTVVTGVVVQGALRVGDTLTLSPSGRSARVRALHVQNRAAEEGHVGQRCGVNLAGIELSEVARGDWLLAPRLHAPSARIDCAVRLLPGEPRPLRHWQPVRLHHGAAEIAGRVALLQDEPVAPGQNGLAQLVLDAPIAAACGDRFVLRDTEGRRTIGGGTMLDLRPPQRRRKQPRRLEQLAAIAIEDPAQSLAAQLAIWPFAVDTERFARDRALGTLAIKRFIDTNAHRMAGKWLFGAQTWQRLASSAKGEVAQFHTRHPQLLGPNLQRLRMALDPRLAPDPAVAMLAAMVADGTLAHEGGVYRLPDHRLGLDRADEDLWRRIAPLLGGEARFRPPRTGEIAPMLGAREFDCRRVLKAKAQQGAVSEIAPDHFFLRETLAEIAAHIGELGAQGEFAAAELRDRLLNGRKVAIQLLEWFDRQGATLRRGDLRTVDPRRLARYRESQPA